MYEERDRAGAEGWRAMVDRTVAEHRARTRVIATRLSTSDQSDQEPEPEHDHDVVESWMADPRGPAPREQAAARRSPVADAVDRIERGEMSWDDVLSGRAGDRESVTLRAFLTERAIDIRTARKARG